MGNARIHQMARGSSLGIVFGLLLGLCRLPIGASRNLLRVDNRIGESVNTHCASGTAGRQQAPDWANDVRAQAFFATKQRASLSSKI